jgi:CheY-like chemotaxis protein
MHDRRSYELIFMDCQMPELDGYEATAAIRRRETAPCHTPIIAMTANTLKGDRERCLDAGMDDYVGKPLRPGELDEVLSRALGSADADADAGADEELPGPEHAAPAAHEDGQGLSAEPLMDPSRLDDAFGDDAQGRATLLALFVDRSRLAVAELAAAIGARDSAAGARLAHGLKGSAAVVGAARLSALSGTSCEALAAGRLDEAGALQSELERTFELTATSLTGSADG